jgi:hypothetical protein
MVTRSNTSRSARSSPSGLTDRGRRVAACTQTQPRCPALPAASEFPYRTIGITRDEHPAWLVRRQTSRQPGRPWHDVSARQRRLAFRALQGPGRCWRDARREMNVGAPRGSRACCMILSSRPVPERGDSTGGAFRPARLAGAHPPRVDGSGTDVSVYGRLRPGMRARRRDGRPRPTSCSGGSRRGRRLRMPRGQGPS